jgi:hypothetical protein
MNVFAISSIISLLLMILMINIYTTYLFLNLALDRNPYRIISDDNMGHISIYLNESYYHYYNMYQKMNMIENEVCDIDLIRDEI